jgi:hypothetical protein
MMSVLWPMLYRKNKVLDLAEFKDIICFPKKKIFPTPSSSPVRTQDFHSCNAGSNPAGVANMNHAVCLGLRGFFMDKRHVRYEFHLFF